DLGELLGSHCGLKWAAMKLSLVRFAVLLAAAGCSGASNSDLLAEGPSSTEDSAALTSGHVSLRIPIIDAKGKPLSKHNARLHAGGLPTFPNSVEIQGGADGTRLPNADKKFHDASKLVDTAFEKLHLELEMEQLGEPFEYKTSDPTTTICY